MQGSSSADMEPTLRRMDEGVAVLCAQQVPARNCGFFVTPKAHYAASTKRTICLVRGSLPCRLDGDATFASPKQSAMTIISPHQGAKSRNQRRNVAWNARFPCCWQNATSTCVFLTAVWSFDQYAGRECPVATAVHMPSGH